MFEPTQATPLPPHSASIKSFIELMHEISGDSIDPIHFKVVAPLLTHPNATTPLPTQPSYVLIPHQTPPHQPLIS